MIDLADLRSRETTNRGFKVGDQFVARILPCGCKYGRYRRFKG